MKIILSVLLLGLILTTTSHAGVLTGQRADVVQLAQTPTNQSDEDIRQRIIQQSISRYSGSCPCPYNRARNGSRCGKRSAYSRPGGASPLCFPGDVSGEMILRFRQVK